MFRRWQSPISKPVVNLATEIYPSSLTSQPKGHPATTFLSALMCEALLSLVNMAVWVSFHWAQAVRKALKEPYFSRPDINSNSDRFTRAIKVQKLFSWMDLSQNNIRMSHLYLLEGKLLVLNSNLVVTTMRCPWTSLRIAVSRCRSRRVVVTTMIACLKIAVQCKMLMPYTGRMLQSLRLNREMFSQGDLWMQLARSAITTQERQNRGCLASCPCQVHRASSWRQKTFQNYLALKTTSICLRTYSIKLAQEPWTVR